MGPIGWQMPAVPPLGSANGVISSLAVQMCTKPAYTTNVHVVMCKMTNYNHTIIRTPVPGSLLIPIHYMCQSTLSSHCLNLHLLSVTTQFDNTVTDPRFFVQGDPTSQPDVAMFRKMCMSKPNNRDH